MSDTDRERTEHGRRLAESLRRAAQIAEGEGEGEIRVGPRVLPRESEGFRDGVEAQRHLRENVCPNGDSPLGPYIPQPRPENTRALGGRGMYALFQEFMLAWFERQNPARLATIDELVDERQERRVVRRYFKRLKHALIAAVVGSFVAAHWFSDQVAWVIERFPDLQALFRLITRGRP